ncbi:MAG: hypothetical protein HLUCCO16_02310, partial [Phormidium sp. OSCR]
DVGPQEVVARGVGAQLGDVYWWEVRGDEGDDGHRRGVVGERGGVETVS